jgi:uncharacterized protein
VLPAIITIGGLALFEVVSSIDNAIVNAHVLKTLPERYRRFFLVWGLLFAVVLMRGLLPFFIVWLANMELSFTETVTFAFTDPELMAESLEHSKPLLLAGGGVYLLLVSLGWLFQEEKKYAWLGEQVIHRMEPWFHAVAAAMIGVVMYQGVSSGAHPYLPLSVQLGAIFYFGTEALKKNAERVEESLAGAALSAWSKLLYLEVLDASFSIDGVVGAFAFTTSVPLILAGNGLGAIVVREVTIRGIDLVSRFGYLKNGAMYSIGILGAIMVGEAFGFEPPFWVAPACTVGLVIFFLWMSIRDADSSEQLSS